jgi:hypothetical protein
VDPKYSPGGQMAEVSGRKNLVWVTHGVPIDGHSAAVGTAAPRTISFRANYEIAYYTTSLNGNGKHHKIRVICERKDVHLQTEHEFMRCRWWRRAVPRKPAKHAF